MSVNTFRKAFISGVCGGILGPIFFEAGMPWGLVGVIAWIVGLINMGID